MTDTKRCSKCKQIKPVNEFYRNKSMAGGYANQCISCFKETHKKYRDSDKGKERDLRYRSTEKWQEIHQAANRKYKQTEASKTSYASYYQRNKHKNRARGRIFDAVRSGRIKPATDFPCVHCGKPALEYHHHLGYDDAHSFDVIPLCKTCHIAADQ